MTRLQSGCTIIAGDGWIWMDRSNPNILTGTLLLTEGQKDRIVTLDDMSRGSGVAWPCSIASGVVGGLRGRNMKRVLIAAGCCLLAGCSTALERPQAVSVGRTPGLVLPADVRLVTERPLTPQAIVCAEPSPDTSKALSTLAKLQASGQTPAGVEVGVGGGRSTAEALTALAGRTAAVVALRDGLFRACEARANGLISRASYALILSQYGDLLVTLTLGEAAAGSGMVPAVAGAAPSAPDMDDKPPSRSPAPAGSTPAATATAAEAPALQPALIAVALTGGASKARGAAATSGAAKGSKQGAAAPAPTTPSAAKPGAGAAAIPAASPGDASAAIAKLYFDSAQARGKNAFFSVCVALAGELYQPGTPAFDDANTRAALSSACVQHLLNMKAREDAEIASMQAAARRDETASRLLEAQASSPAKPSHQAAGGRHAKRGRARFTT